MDRERVWQKRPEHFLTCRTLILSESCSGGRRAKTKQVAKNNATMEALGYQSCSHRGHFENAKSLLAFIGRVDVASLGPGKTIAVL